MSKRIAWSLLKIPKPDGSRTLQQYLKQGLNYFDFFHPVQGKYVLEIGSEEIKNLDRRPTTSELQQAWRIAAADLAAEQEMEHVAKKITDAQLEKKTLAQKQADKMKRVWALIEFPRRYFPSLKTRGKESEEDKAKRPNIFTTCEVSQVLNSIPPLPDENAFMAEVGQLMDKHEGNIRVENTEDAAELERSQVAMPPLLQQQLQAIERVARSRGWRMNKLFYREDYSDYVCTGPDESLSCLANTLFYLQALVGGMEQPNISADFLLKASTARVVARIAGRKFAMPTLARIGLGVACDDKHIVFVRVDLEDEPKIPVYVSEVLPIAEGLRYLARLMCCSSAEQFGLLVGKLLELLPSSYKYVRALGSGSDTEVVAVRDEAGAEQSELACKMALYIVSSQILAHEARILGRLPIARGVQRLVRYYAREERESDEDRPRSGLLLTSPVGTPLLEHVKSLRGEGERHSFAQKVFEELKAALSAVHAKGIVHANIAPENIVVVPCENGDDVTVCLIHWSCATDLVEEAKNEQENKIKPWWKNRIQTTYMSDGLLEKLPPTPQDDVQTLLLTYVALRESPCAVPWPGSQAFSRKYFITPRSQWLKEYAIKHPELDLTPLL